MSTCNIHDPVHSAAASCMPHEDMWPPCEPAEITDISPFEANKHVAMVRDVFHYVAAAASPVPLTQRIYQEDSSWAEYRDRVGLNASDSSSTRPTEPFVAGCSARLLQRPNQHRPALKLPAYNTAYSHIPGT